MNCLYLFCILAGVIFTEIYMDEAFIWAKVFTQFPVHGILPSDVEDVSTEVKQSVLKLSHKFILCYSNFLFDCNSGGITTILTTYLFKGPLSQIYLFALKGSEE